MTPWSCTSTAHTRVPEFTARSRARPRVRSPNIPTTGLKDCARPACTETITLKTSVPASALSTEMGKKVYAYSGLNLTKTPSANRVKCLFPS